MKSLNAILSLLCMTTFPCFAQLDDNQSMNDSSESDSRKKTVLAQKLYPKGMDNYSFSVFYYNGKEAFNNRGVVLCSSSDSIIDLKVNPSNTSFATLNKTKKGATYVSLYNVSDYVSLKKKIKIKDLNAIALAYSKDAKQLAIAYANKSITIYNAITNEVLREFSSAIVPTKLEYSDNNYFLSISNGQSIEIWNLEKNTIRKIIEMNEKVNDFAFSVGSNFMYVLTNNGKLNIFDSKTFTNQNAIDVLRSSSTLIPYLTDKYVVVLENDKRLSIINVLDPTERHILLNDNGGVNTMRLAHDNTSEKMCVIYNDANDIVYQSIEGLKPYFNQMMTTMLSERLNEWTKRMPEESLEAYQLRVNETTRAAHAKELERELATQMATGLLEMSDVTIGDYNTNKKSLALHFNTMPDIFLDVPSSELNAFSDASKLQFRNVKYGLNPDDKFELVYAEVYNPENGRTYLFNNMERETLSYIQEDFVPLEIVQTSNMEETALVSIKEDFVNDAQQEQVITDKTHISVKTDAVPSVNAEGDKIVNYNVEFTYEVEQDFSARDDFKPGRYHTNESPAAMLMLKIMKQAFEKDFAKYMVEGKKVKISVKGTADASPIAHALPYDGRYGEYSGEPVYKNNELNSISLNKKEGIANNEQLAFARAIGLQNYIEKEISAFGKMNREYEYYIEVSEETGSQFRRISVQYTFIDAFKQ